MKVDIVLVSYNSKKYIENCIESIAKSEYDLKNIGIYIYDNNSTDNSVEILEKIEKKYQQVFNNIKIIKGEKNLGFGIANNKAAKYTTAEYLFFLNIDCEIYKDTLLKIEKTLNEKANDNVGIFELKQEKYEHPKYYDPITKETKWASGACMIMKKELFKKIRGFDKNIFLYCEDVEISFRIRKLGYKILYLNNIPIIHYSYNEAYEFKKSQYVNSVPNNLYLRLKYGKLKDIIKGYFLYLLFYKQIAENTNIDINSVDGIKKEIKRNKNKMILKGIIQYLSRIKFILKKDNTSFVFSGFDYHAVREGAFYQIKKINTNPLVSVIVRTCNRPDVLKETLISLRNQTYKNIEIVIVEDGKGISKEMIDKEFGDLKIKYFAFGKKVGRCKAGNKALAMASGKYFNFLDDDDLFYEDHIETLVSELETCDEKIAYANSFETPIIVYSKTPYKYKILSEYIGISTEYNPLKILYNNITPIQCVMFEKEVYEKCGGFDEELDALEDWDLWIRYSLKYSFKFVNRTTSIYRVPGDKEEIKKRGEFLNSYLEKVRNKHKYSSVETNMNETISFYEYILYLNANPTLIRMEKLKKIFQRGKK